jgi:uncharacterized cupredoxin-like copper-binding protein
MAVVVIVVAAIGIFYGVMQPSQPSTSPPPASTVTKNITIYAGELTSKYGFGLSASTIESPGPTLTFKVGDIVNATVFNVGNLPHAWRITDSNATNANVLFNAEVTSGSSPLTPGASGSTIFTVNKAGNYYYICPVPGHVQLGMWGKIVVNS